MKLATCLIAVVVLCMCGAALAANTPGNARDVAAELAEKNSRTFGVPDPIVNVGGEDIGSATPIPALPYSDGGNTCQFLDDYDEICPYSGSTSPDVVYSYSPAGAEAIDISICNSLYDTKVYVYENSSATLVACNDDACGSDGFKSELEGVPVNAGNTYYIVVDGYFGDCGEYDLQVNGNVPCIVDCPSGAIAEGEPVCHDDYQDNTNGGCNSNPDVWTQLPCDPAGVTVCGQYGGFLFNGLSYRDTDWYEVNVLNASNITMCVEGEAGTLMGIINGNLGCGAPFFETSLVIGDCDPQCLNYAVGPGLWWFFVATSDFGPAAGACGSDYVMTIDGLDCPPISVEPATWGEIKSDFR